MPEENTDKPVISWPLDPVTQQSLRRWLDENGFEQFAVALAAAIGVSVQAYDAELAQIAALADPNADRILFWDDSAGEMKYLSLGTGLSITDTTINVSSTEYYNGIFGDGSDGDLTSSSGTTTLTKDMYYDDVTISGTAIINPAGYRIFIKGTLTISGSAKIIRTGNAGGNGGNATGRTPGTGGTAGAVMSGVTVPDGNAGTVGVSGGLSPNNINDEAGTAGDAGNAGTSIDGSIGGTGATSVAGGAGGAYAGFNGGNGGASAVGGVITAPKNTPRNLFDTINLWNPKTFVLHKSSSAPGSGGGGGGGGHAVNREPAGGGGSGGTGSDGGFIAVYAKTIVNSVAGGISCNGGVGGNGGNGGNGGSGGGIGAGGGGGGAGGTGGTGGVIIVVYSSLTQSGSGSFLASGGAGGTGGTGGTYSGTNSVNGSNGNTGTTGAAGVVWQLQVV